MAEGNSQNSENETEWHLSASLRILLGGWRFLAACSIAGMALALAVALILKPWYIAEAIFLPPKPEVSASDPFATLLGANDASDAYLGMITSRTVADDIIDRLNLVTVYKSKLRTDARTELTRNSKFTVNKNSLIVVDVTDHDPKLAAAIANAYLDSLYRLNGVMARSASDHRRAFFEEQLAAQKAALADAEADLKVTQQHTGVVLPANQAQANLTATAQLQALIGATETRLAGLLTSATEQNPQVVEARSQLHQLQAQLASQQSTGTQLPGSLATARQLPEFVQQNLEKEREVKLRETVYDALVAQYEKARLAAADPGPQLKIVDQAVVPERKSGPPRQLMTIGGWFIGLIVGIVWLTVAPGFRRLGTELQEPQPAGKG